MLESTWLAQGCKLIHLEGGNAIEYLCLEDDLHCNSTETPMQKLCLQLSFLLDNLNHAQPTYFRFTYGLTIMIEVKCPSFMPTLQGDTSLALALMNPMWGVYDTPLAINPSLPN